MTTDEALKELRTLQEIYQGPHLALVPVGNTSVFDVVNIARSHHDPYINTIIACGSSVAEAVMLAKKKLEEL